VISKIWEATTAERINIDTYRYYQRQNCSLLNVVFSDVYYADIAGDTSARHLQLEYSDGCLWRCVTRIICGSVKEKP